MNDDDELLAGLRRAARDEEVEDADFRRLAEGDLSAAERARLESRARGDASIGPALEAYRPFDAAEIDRFASSIDSLAAPPAPARPPSLASFRRARAVAWVAVPLAAAAAVALWVGRPPASLPEYELGFAANVQSVRADGPAELVPEAQVSRGATFEMVVRPTEPSRVPVAARAALVRDGHARPWSAPLAISRDGAVRVVGPAASLFPDPSGAYEVVVAIGSPGDLPTDERLVALAEGRGEAPRGTRVLRGRVVLVE